VLDFYDTNERDSLDDVDTIMLARWSSEVLFAMHARACDCGFVRR
jgi:hypothetical protein